MNARPGFRDPSACPNQVSNCTAESISSTSNRDGVSVINFGQKSRSHDSEVAGVSRTHSLEPGWREGHAVSLVPQGALALKSARDQYQCMMDIARRMVHPTLAGLPRKDQNRERARPPEKQSRGGTSCPRTIGRSIQTRRARHRFARTQKRSLAPSGRGKRINRSNRPGHHGCVETRVAGNPYGRNTP